MTKKLWEPKRKCPKAIPRHLQNHVERSRILKCSVKPYVTRPSTKCYFNEFLSIRILTHDRINQRLWAFGVPWSPNFVLGLPPKSGFWKQSKWAWNMIHSMPCKNPSRFYIHLAFTCCSVNPSSVVWSELGPAPPFPPMRVLEVKWSWALSLVCEVALRATSHMSQEPWPCNGEDPWLSFKGHTMGVGIAVLCSHGPSSIVWSENGPCCGTIVCFVGGKRGENLI
jgi:hypothetical protein